MLYRRNFTPSVQDSDSQSDSEHVDKESRDYCRVILAKTSQKMTVNLLMMVLINLPIIEFTCQYHVSAGICLFVSCLTS